MSVFFHGGSTYFPHSQVAVLLIFYIFLSRGSATTQIMDKYVRNKRKQRRKPPSPPPGSSASESQKDSPPQGQGTTQSIDKYVTNERKQNRNGSRWELSEREPENQRRDKIDPNNGHIDQKSMKTEKPPTPTHTPPPHPWEPSEREPESQPRGKSRPK